MNLLIDGLPEEIEIAGQVVRINTDFRTGILFEEMMQDGSLDPMQKIATALELYFPGTCFAPDTVMDAMEQVLRFYRCGEEEAESTGQGSGQALDPPFSYEYDANYIYAAFMAAYRIDLARNTLHWWQFRALFQALPEDTQFMKIVGYRTMKIPAKIPKEQREHYQKMKKLYRLPQSADRQQLESDLSNLLMNGGNPAAILEQ